MKKSKGLHYEWQTLKLNAWTNVVLGVLVLSIGALCLAPMDESLQTEGERAHIYRSGNAKSGGVSLMFNVYEGADEVYRILDALKTHDAKATFFIGGCWADDNVACLRAIYEAGHEIGNHGYFHKDHTKLSLMENQREIANCNRFIELTIGLVPVLFAPPSGAYNDAMLTACELLHLKTVLWSRDTIDWRDQDKHVIYERATRNIKSGEFVLMHPTRATANVLADILTYYQSQGLTAITVSENLETQNEG